LKTDSGVTRIGEEGTCFKRAKGMPRIGSKSHPSHGGGWKMSEGEEEGKGQEEGKEGRIH
jgi:hypothetical protein